MPTLNCPLVGMHFRPPAKQVLGHLPTGARLQLVPEPSNPYDAKAIKVLVVPAEIPLSQDASLEQSLEGTGDTVETVRSTSQIHLGYIADSDGKSKPPAGNREVAALADGNWLEIEAALIFGADGKPRVLVRRRDS